MQKLTQLLKEQHSKKEFSKKPVHCLEDGLVAHFHTGLVRVSCSWLPSLRCLKGAFISVHWYKYGATLGIFSHLLSTILSFLCGKYSCILLHMAAIFSQMKSCTCHWNWSNVPWMPSNVYSLVTSLIHKNTFSLSKLGPQSSLCWLHLHKHQKCTFSRQYALNKLWACYLTAHLILHLPQTSFKLVFATAHVTTVGSFCISHRSLCLVAAVVLNGNQ